MGRLSRIHWGSWPLLIVSLCFVVLVGCQDGSGPGLVNSPDGKPAYDGAKPPPPPPANPEIAGMYRGDIVIMDADGSNVTPVVLSEGGQIIGQASWSPDGTQLVYMEHYTGLWVVNRDGSNNHLIVPHSACGRKCNEPRWSPAGDEISCINSEDWTWTLWIFPASGGAGEILYQTSDAAISRPEWNSDGTQLVFDSSTWVGSSTLQVIDRATGVRTSVLSIPETEGRFVSGSWARQGVDTIAYFFWDNVNGGDPQIYTLDISEPGQTPEFVTYGMWPIFSPDNAKIVFEGPVPHRLTYSYTFATGAIDLISRKVSHTDWRR